MEKRFSLVKYLVFYHEDLFISRFLRMDEIESNHGDDDQENNNMVINDHLEAVIEQVIIEHRLDDEPEIEGPVANNQLNNAQEQINRQFKGL